LIDGYDEPREIPFGFAQIIYQTTEC